MSPVLENELGNILKDFNNNLGQAKEFTLAQAPALINSYINYGIITNVIILVISLIIGVVSFFIIKTGIKIQQKDSYSCDEIPYFLFGGLLGVASFIFTIDSFYQLLLIYFAPKIWLIQQAASLLKGH